MYLATLQEQGKTRYQIRQSVPAGAQKFVTELVFDLGKEPHDFFEIFNDHIVLFNAALTDAVEQRLERDSEPVLEKLLYRFFPPDTRRRLDMFSTRGKIQVTPLTDDDREAISSQVHLFDRRRMYYLRYGAVDQSRLYRMHEKCCRPLIGQSRDEREYFFAEQERVLRSREYFQYVYAIFNLQSHFSESFAPWFPEGLAKEAVADYFVEELCRLNRDTRFWQQSEPNSTLDPHFIRYLIMFFDYQPVARSFFDDYLHRFMAGHRQFKWPEQQAPASPEQISEVFGASYHNLKKMAGTELTRLYRQQALKLHPDKGGDHEQFIALTTAYKALMKAK